MRSGGERRTLRPFARLGTEPTEFVTQHRRTSSESGFTLIELLIVTAVLPIVIGAIAMGMLSVFSLQGSTSNRLSDSGGAQIVSYHFQNDVQSTVDITTASSPTDPAPCVPSGSSQVQVLGMELGDGSVVTYGAAPASSGTNDNLWRNVCAQGSNQPVTTLMAHDVDPTAVGVSIACTATSPACSTGTGSTPAYQSSWVSTLGVTGVTLRVTAPLSSYHYSVTSTPMATANSSQLATVSTPSTGCGFATPGTGTYASTLCFVDFTPWTTQTRAQNVSGCGTALPMSANISNTPFTLSFCMSVSASWNTNSGKSGSIPAGPTSGPPPGCSSVGLSGYNDIAAVPLPTYYCPPDSSAFLGNNGFYTGVPGNPALYTVDSGSTAVISFTNIKLMTSNGAAASNWELVTGDAESTDPNEAITWHSDQNLFLLPNSTNSPVGNACGSTPPSYNNNPSYGSLTGVGSMTVVCNASQSEIHTGTVMLEAKTPSSLAVTLTAGGLQAAFLGVLVP